MAGDQGQDFRFAWIQHRDSSRRHHSGRHDAVAVVAAQRGERDDVVLPDVSQGPEERVPMRGKSGVTRLARQCRAGNMADSTPQSVFARSFEDDRGQADALDLDAANRPSSIVADHRAAGFAIRDAFREPRARHPVAVRTRCSPPWKIHVSPTPPRNSPRPDGAREENALHPPQNPLERLFRDHEPHLATLTPAGCDSPPAM